MNTSTIGGPSGKKKYVNDDLEERERRISSNILVTPNPSTITKSKKKTESINPFISKNQYDSLKVEEEKTNPETINKFESFIFHQFPLEKQWIMVYHIGNRTMGDLFMSNDAFLILFLILYYLS